MHKPFLCLMVATPVFAQYAGPAILSRGEAPAAMELPKIDFRPFLEVGATYDTGLAGLSGGSQQDLAGNSSYGLEFTAGVSGVHSWKHTKLSLDYTGTFNHYVQKSVTDGTSQSLSLAITHEISRRISVSLRESAGMYYQNFTSLGLPQTVPFDASQSYVPVTDFFNNRTAYSTTQADIKYRKNARLSFDFGGDYFLNSRASSALYSAAGIAARGDAQYRISRRTTIGAEYSFARYTYTGILGSSNLHSAVGTFSTRLTRWWEFSGSAGITRVENRFAEEVPLAPIVAELLGTATGTQLVYGIEYVPSVNGRLSRTFHKGIFWVSGGRTVTPGNGLFLSSKMTNGTTGYSYTGMRKWSFTSQAMYDRGTSMGNVLGTYADISGGVSGSRQITRSLHFVAGVEVRRYESPGFSLYNRNVYDAHIGLGFAPGVVPLRLW